MGRNGRQTPVRPRIDVQGASASPAEAAAIAAAIEQFLRDTAPAPDEGAPRVSPWLRAAIFEGAGMERGAPGPWGDPEPWGRGGN